MPWRGAAIVLEIVDMENPPLDHRRSARTAAGGQGGIHGDDKVVDVGGVQAVGGARDHPADGPIEKARPGQQESASVHRTDAEGAENAPGRSQLRHVGVEAVQEKTERGVTFLAVKGPFKIGDRRVQNGGPVSDSSFELAIPPVIAVFGGHRRPFYGRADTLKPSTNPRGQGYFDRFFVPLFGRIVRLFDNCARRGGGSRPGGERLLAQTTHNGPDIGDGFGVGRHAAVAVYRFGTGVVGGKGLGLVTIEPPQQTGEVVGSAVDIRRRVEGINAQRPRRSRHQLHHAPGAFRGHRRRVEPRLPPGHRRDQPLAHLVARGGVADGLGGRRRWGRQSCPTAARRAGRFGLNPSRAGP